MGIITMIPHSRHRVNRETPRAVLVFVYHHVSFLSIGNRCSGPGGGDGVTVCDGCVTLWGGG